MHMDQQRSWTLKENKDLLLQILVLGKLVLFIIGKIYWLYNCSLLFIPKQTFLL